MRRVHEKKLVPWKQIVKTIVLDIWPSKMGPIGSPETSVRNEPKLRNIPEDDRIKVNRGETCVLEFRIGFDTFCV